MNDLEAISAAKRYLNEVFEEEKITDISLEEIVHGGDRWLITLGFLDRGILLALERRKY